MSGSRRQAKPFTSMPTASRFDLSSHDPRHLVDVIGLFDEQVIFVRELAAVVEVANVVTPGKITKNELDAADDSGAATTGVEWVTESTPDRRAAMRADLYIRSTLISSVSQWTG